MDGTEIVIGDVIEYLRFLIRQATRRHLPEQGLDPDKLRLLIVGNDRSVFSWLKSRDSLWRLARPARPRPGDANSVLARWRSIEQGAPGDNPEFVYITATMTDYYTRISTARFIRDKPEVRLAYCSLAPSKQKSIGGIVLHFLVLFADDYILGRNRSSKMVAFEPGTISFSGEETFFVRNDHVRRSECHGDRTIDELFRRAILEEVADNIPEIQRSVTSYRAISIGYEEPLGNHFIFGVVVSALSHRRYIDLLRHHRRSAFASFDREGCRSAISPDDAIALLRGRKVRTNLTETEVAEVIDAEVLHPTSAYRLWRGLQLLNAVR